MATLKRFCVYQHQGKIQAYHACLSCIDFTKDRRLRKWLRKYPPALAVRYRAVEILKEHGISGGFVALDYRSELDDIIGLHAHAIVALSSSRQITHHAAEQFFKSGWIIRLFPRNREAINQDPSTTPEFMMKSDEDRRNVADYILRKAVIGIGSMRIKSAYARFGFCRKISVTP
jgi:hypothetical protein